MHLICESRLYTESSVYFAHNPLVKCSLFISQSDYKKNAFCSAGTHRLLESCALSTTMYYIIQIPHHYDK